MSKQYGLIIPSKGLKTNQKVIVRPSIFDEDSDSDTTPAKPTGLKKTVKKQDKINHDRAVEQDPTVYQYDEIYDEMDRKRKETLLSKKDIEKKPKYITKLLAAADKRKRENERRIEKQVQKEREAEGDEFRDKESFVTTAYRKKLEEMKELEEQEQREDYLERIGDVKKQGNLDGFYRHLYDQKVNYEEKSEVKKEEEEIKEEPKYDNDEPSLTPERKRKQSSDESETEDEKIKDSKAKRAHRKSKRDDSDSDSSSRTPERKRKTLKEEIEDSRIKSSIKRRKYRKREDSDSEQSDKEETEVKKEHLPSNLDADSDFSIDSSDSEDEEKDTSKKEQKHEEIKTVEESEKAVEDKTANSETGKEVEKKEEEKVEKVIEEKPKKPKIDIWKKRTVGEVFDAALKRYFERKALRQDG